MCIIGEKNVELKVLKHILESKDEFVDYVQNCDPAHLLHRSD